MHVQLVIILIHVKVQLFLPEVAADKRIEYHYCLKFQDIPELRVEVGP